MKVYLVYECDMGGNISDIVAVFTDYNKAKEYSNQKYWYNIMEKEVQNT